MDVRAQDDDSLPKSGHMGRRFVHDGPDALGSVAALTGPDGHVTQTYAYTAFGTLRHQPGPDLNRVTYTAREHLGDSQGWMYYRHRVYSPGLGRFTSAGPLEFVDGVNPWIYTFGNPITYIQMPGAWIPRVLCYSGFMKGMSTMLTIGQSG